MINFARALGWTPLLLAATASSAAIEPRQAIGVYPAPNSNNFSCHSTTHPNPVVFLHGLGANKDEDTNVLEAHMESLGFCTFAITYGETLLPGVGGLMHIADSAPLIASFIKEVQSKTGASKVDIVGHSEGAFQSLYVPKFEAGVSSIVDKIVAIAPPTHGTTFHDLYTLASIAGFISKDVVDLILQLGCPACDDLVTNGAAIQKLNDGKPIRQGSNDITVIISSHDEAVTPVNVAQVNEPGVRNLYIQDRCSQDPVGHIGEAYDTYVWSIVVNALDPTSPLGACALGLPY